MYRTFGQNENFENGGANSSYSFDGTASRPSPRHAASAPAWRGLGLKAVASKLSEELAPPCSPGAVVKDNEICQIEPNHSGKTSFSGKPYRTIQNEFQNRPFSTIFNDFGGGRANFDGRDDRVAVGVGRRRLACNLFMAGPGCMPIFRPLRPIFLLASFRFAQTYGTFGQNRKLIKAS